MKQYFKSESGQAIAEMAVAMIAMMVVFLGIIFAFALGSLNIDNLLTCRETADKNAYDNVYSHSGDQIRTWSSGNDERLFTNDDVSLVGTNDAPDGFKQELRSDEIDLVNGFDKNYVHNNFASDLSGIDALFLSTANLTSHSNRTYLYDNDTMNLDDLQGAFSALLFSSEMIIDNEVYMPLLNMDSFEEASTE